MVKLLMKKPVRFATRHFSPKPLKDPWRPAPAAKHEAPVQVSLLSTVFRPKRNSKNQPAKEVVVTVLPGMKAIYDYVNRSEVTVLRWIRELCFLSSKIGGGNWESDMELIVGEENR